MQAATFKSQRFPLTRTALTLMGLCVFVTLAAWGVLNLTAHAEQLPAMLGTGAVALAASVLAMTPIGPLARRCEQGIVHGVQVSILLRLMLTLGGAALLAALTPLTTRQVGFWTIIWYLVLLIAEVVLMLAYLRADREVAA